MIVQGRDFELVCMCWGFVGGVVGLAAFNLADAVLAMHRRKPLRDPKTGKFIKRDEK